jgi:16S rRNA (uracil1498-N3)-methyltransferase
LNVGAVQWMSCEHGVVKPREGGGKMEKWRRLAVESAKQCGRAHLLEIREPMSVDDVLGAGAVDRVLWLDPGPGGKTVAQALSGFVGGTVMALVGPEGGWSDDERRLLETRVAAGTIQRVRLTSTVLRIETACAAVGAIVMGALTGP